MSWVRKWAYLKLISAHKARIRSEWTSVCSLPHYDENGRKQTYDNLADESEGPLLDTRYEVIAEVVGDFRSAGEAKGNAFVDALENYMKARENGD